MRRLALACFGAMFAISAAVAAGAASADPGALEHAAKAVEAAIASEERVEALFALFDAEMRRAVPLAQLRGMLGDLRSGMGKVVSRKETSRPQPGAAAYRLGMERGELEMSLALDADGKIRGLLLRPPGATPEGSKFDAVGGNLEAAIRAGDAKGLARDFAASTRAALPEPKLRELLASLGGQMGKLQTRGAARRPSPDTAIWPMEFEKGTIDLKVVLDGEGKVIGIWFLPPGAAGDAPKASERNAVKLRLPFRGRWEVFWGGATREQNAHHDVANQRHAFDFVGLHADGQRYRGEGTRNEDWAAYGREVLAPADGRVTDVIEGVRDNRPGSMNPYAAVGNTVVLRLSEEEYAVLAHLKPGSVRVRTGQTVARGAVLGLCGNSGNSSEPHLHFHLQQTPVLQDGLGIRCHFERVVLDRAGQRESRTDYSPERGDVIVGD
jgi:murein DD-endopeptidase MepM/ murein hydrolase activator NlpD